MPRPHQIHMPLALPARLSRESFVVAPCNATALAMLDQPEWPAGKLVLTGREGAGKTHLLHIWASETGAEVLEGGALAQADPAALASVGRVAIDNAQDVATSPEGQAALFHLHNLLAAQGGGCCWPRVRLRAIGGLACRIWPRAWRQQPMSPLPPPMIPFWPPC
jgi:hypothetical protein